MCSQQIFHAVALFPQTFLRKWRYCLSNAGIWAGTNMKCAKAISNIAHYLLRERSTTTLQLYIETPVLKIRYAVSPIPISYPQVRPIFVLTTHLGRPIKTIQCSSTLGDLKTSH